jgi:benzodiazapine receptor
MSAVMVSERSRAVILAAVAAAVVAALGALITDLGPWYYSLEVPSWKPPDWLFGPAWTVIFTLAALSGYLSWTRASRYSPNSARILALFAINGLLNIAWSALFFRMHRLDWALLEVVLLWLSIAGLMYLTGRNSRLASLLLLPYLLWVSFAGYLNWVLLRLNGPTGMG